ncbi:MAG: MFS transporter [Bacteroidota bacterium]
MTSLGKISKIILLLASSLTVMSVSAISPALPKIAEAFAYLPNAVFLVKLMLTIPSLIIACSAPFAGIIIDKGKRKTLLVTSLILYAITGTTGLYLDSIEGFLIARAFLGISVAGIMTSAQTLIADYYYGEERTKALGLQGTFISFGGVLFVAIAGLLATISWRYPFSLYGLALLLAYPAFLYIHEPKQKHKEEIVDNLEHSTYTMHTISIIGICCIVFSGMVIFYCIPTQLPFLLQSYGIDSPAKAGAIVSLATLCGGITSFLMPKLKKIISFARLGSLSFGLLAIGFFGIQITPSYPIILFSALFAGAGIGLLMPSMRLWVITLANPKIRGRSVGFLTSSLYLGQFLSPIIAQPIVSLQSIQSLYFIIAIIAGTLSIILFLKSKKDI